MYAVGFDLDGSLLDTLADIGSACNAVLARHGYPQHPVAAYARMVGSGFDVLVRRALPQNHMPDACALAAITAEVKDWYAAHMLDGTVPYPGVAEALRSLAGQGIALYVLSNKSEAMTVDLIAHFFSDVPFQAVKGAVPDTPLKPDARAIRSLLGPIGAQASAYVGDSDIDMRTALNAGVAAVGAAWGFRGAEELRAAGCQIMLGEPCGIATLPDILGWQSI